MLLVNVGTAPIDADRRTNYRLEDRTVHSSQMNRLTHGTGVMMAPG